MTAHMFPSPTNPNSFDVECPDHTDAERHGLRWNHARNAMEQHNREHHDTRPQEFQVGLMAALLLTLRDDMLDAARDHSGDPDKGWAITFTQRRYQEGLSAWMTLCGFQASQQDEALALARKCSQEGTVAHVAPF